MLSFYLLRDVPCGVLQLFLLKCTPSSFPQSGSCDPLYFPSLERLSPRPSLSCPLPDQPNQQSLHTHHTCRPAVLSVRKALTFKEIRCKVRRTAGKPRVVAREKKRQQGASMVMGRPLSILLHLPPLGQGLAHTKCSGNMLRAFSR